MRWNYFIFFFPLLQIPIFMVVGSEWFRIEYNFIESLIFIEITAFILSVILSLRIMKALHFIGHSLINYLPVKTRILGIFNRIKNPNSLYILTIVMVVFLFVWMNKYQYREYKRQLIRINRITGGVSYYDPGSMVFIPAPKPVNKGHEIDPKDIIFDTPPQRRTLSTPSPARRSLNATPMPRRSLSQ